MYNIVFTKRTCISTWLQGSNHSHMRTRWLRLPSRNIHAIC